jgi:type I restriction enzyme S subunit
LTNNYPPGWTVKSISAFSERVERRVSGVPEHVLMIASRSGFVAQSDKYDRFMAGQSLQKYIDLRSGEFAYNKGNSISYPCGCVFRLKGYHSAAVPFVYFCFAVQEDVAEPAYLEQFFAGGGLNAQLKGRINSGVRNNGLLNIRAGEFFSCVVPLPPVQEQRKIAAILSSVDEAIEGTQAVIDQLQVVKKAMMADLLTRGIPGRHSKFKQTEIGEVPEEWEVGSISSFVEEMRGGSPLTPSDFVEEGFTVLHKGDILPDGIVQLAPNSSRYASTSFAEGHQRSVIDSNFLVATLRDLVPSGPSIGLISRVPQDRNLRLLLAQGAYGLRLDANSMDPDYLIAVSNSAFYRQAARRIAVGSTQIHIRNGDFLALRIPIPSPEERRTIGQAIAAFSALLSEERRTIGGLRALKTGLMDDLLTGRRRVCVEQNNGQ